MKNTNRALSDVLINSKNNSLHGPILPHCASNPVTLTQPPKEEPMDWYLGTDFHGSNTIITPECSSSPTPSLCSVPHSPQLRAVPSPRGSHSQSCTTGCGYISVRCRIQAFPHSAARENPGFRTRGSITLWSLDHHCPSAGLGDQELKSPQIPSSA